VHVPFWSRGRKVEYYNAATVDRAEVGTDLFSADAEDDDVWFSPYANLAGSMMYFGGRNLNTHKIPVAFPGSAVDQASGSFRFGNLRLAKGVPMRQTQRNNSRQARRHRLLHVGHR
jgi:hypothetical protein